MKENEVIEVKTTGKDLMQRDSSETCALVPSAQLTHLPLRPLRADVARLLLCVYRVANWHPFFSRHFFQPPNVAVLFLYGKCNKSHFTTFWS